MASTPLVLRTITVAGFSADANYEVTQAIPASLTPLLQNCTVAFSVHPLNGSSPVDGTVDLQVVSVSGTTVNGAVPVSGLPAGRAELVEVGNAVKLGVRVTAFNAPGATTIQVKWREFAART